VTLRKAYWEALQRTGQNCSPTDHSPFGTLCDAGSLTSEPSFFCNFGLLYTGDQMLLAKHFSDRDDPRLAMMLSEFLALAWRLANDKARELVWGWVV
jgi:hypothetical protein